MNIEPASIESANNISLLKTLNIRLVEIGETHAIMEVEVSEIHRNYFGGAHGGLIATLVDTVSFFPRPLLPSGRACTTTNLNVNYVRPASMGEKLTAQSEIVHLGKRTATVNVKIHDSHGRLIAHGTTSLMFLQ
ncbi:MAG TPA: PaaI family thioesterase [Desulfuromonadales bacterium]|nr:PaaI family thioesterase [Desulfuromonadales bacterium]